jgi:hypothetical protein
MSHLQFLDKIWLTKSRHLDIYSLQKVDNPQVRVTKSRRFTKCRTYNF